MSEQRDLVVIGSGPGGYVAAIRAGQLGLKVAVVEKDQKLGGTCLHRGCIPTKALLHTAEVFDEMKHAAELGIDAADPRLDIVRVMARKQKIVDKGAKGIEFLFKKNGVESIHGRGRLTGPNTVEVTRPDGSIAEIKAKHVLVATGSVPREIAVAPTNGTTILNSDHILELDRIPASMIVLGAGAVGCEFASIYASFGTEVTLVELLPRILPIEDEEVSAEVQKAFRKRGIKALTGAKLVAAEPGDGRVEIALETNGKSSKLEAEVLLVAVGRAPVTSDLGLEELGVQLDRGYVTVDAMMATTVPSISAIGDVVPTPWLAHVASAEGILVVEKLAGKTVRPIDYDRVPSCTYCSPEVGAVGLTEAKAKERGYDVATGKFPFSALTKAAILGATAGFVKVVRETKYDELLGVHIVGPHATELIAEACTAMQVEATTEELFRTIHAHPTLSEAVMEAAHAATGQAIHI